MCELHRVLAYFGGYSVDTCQMVGIVHTVSSANLLKRLRNASWSVRTIRGSHHILQHPTIGGHISVPHPKKDLGKGLVHKILKQAGLK